MIVMNRYFKPNALQLETCLFYHNGRWFILVFSFISFQIQEAKALIPLRYSNIASGVLNSARLLFFTCNIIFGMKNIPNKTISQINITHSWGGGAANTDMIDECSAGGLRWKHLCLLTLFPYLITWHWEYPATKLHFHP